MSRSFDPLEDIASILRSIDETLGLILDDMTKRSASGTADTVIAIERDRLARIIFTEFEQGDWDTTCSNEKGVSYNKVMKLLGTR
jgi:hypothetical protein